jgi:flagellar basal body-associated protein FliL
LKRSAKIAIISVIAVAVIISAIALTVHYRLSSIEGNEQNKNETASQIAKEIVGNITGSNLHSEASESAAQHAKELNP